MRSKEKYLQRFKNDQNTIETQFYILFDNFFLSLPKRNGYAAKRHLTAYIWWRICTCLRHRHRSVSAWNCARTSNKLRHSDWEHSVQQHGYETSVVNVPSLRVYFGRRNGVYYTKYTIFQVDSVKLWWWTFSFSFYTYF